MENFSDAAYGQILTSLKNMLITYKALSKERELNIPVFNFLKTKTGHHLMGEVAVNAQTACPSLCVYTSPMMLTHICTLTENVQRASVFANISHVLFFLQK